MEKKYEWSTVNWKDNVKQKKSHLLSMVICLNGEWCKQQGLMWSVS